MVKATLFHTVPHLWYSCWIFSNFFPTPSHFGHGACPSRRAARRGPRWWTRPRSASRAARRWGRSCHRFRPGTNVRKASRPGRMWVWLLFFSSRFLMEIQDIFSFLDICLWEDAFEQLGKCLGYGILRIFLGEDSMEVELTWSNGPLENYPGIPINITW